MPIYLDHAATTPVDPRAAQAALRVMTEEFGNPSSIHALGKQAAAALKEHRRQISEALGCASEDELYFTSGGTEGDNWAIAIAAHLGRHTGKHIITSVMEHAAVLEPIRALKQEGYDVTVLPSDRKGCVSLSDLENALRPDTILVSLMLVNNETGAIQPVDKVGQLLRRTGSSALLHTDAVQGFLKVPFTAKNLGADLITISGHKIGAPKGVGALYIRKGLRVLPLLRGGGQESGLRSGTEFTPQIAAFAAACQAGREGMSHRIQIMRELKAYALTTLPEKVPGLTVVTPGDAPHICAVSLPGYPSEMLVRELSRLGIYVSSGSACHKGKPSHVFAALKLPSPVLQGILRLSFSPENTTADIDALALALEEIRQARVPAGR